jgi:hypothetical protein
MLLRGKAIHARPIPKDLTRGLAANNTPANFVELAAAVVSGTSYGYACAHFLDEFYFYRQAFFFDEEPPTSFDTHRRAFLAAVAEFLSQEFGLPMPAWTEKREYFLTEEWDFAETQPGFNDELRARIDRRRASATPAFKRRNILYEGRNLIRL